MRRIAGTALVLLGTTCATFAFELAPPLDCTFGRDCFIQQYFDRDPGPEALDYHCGHETYGGHDGTDFRVRSLAAPAVSVISPADGTVTAVRDTVPDRLVLTAGDEAAVRSMECGNGVVIDNGGGYQTQLCHMRLGSVVVKPGDRVRTGDRIGIVGASGAAGFPHVHLTLRKDGKAIDPFTGDSAAVTCPAGAEKPDFGDKTLWNLTARSLLRYRGLTILDVGFADHEVTQRELEERAGTMSALTADARQVLVYARVLHVEKGDVLRLQAYGPSGFSVNGTTAPYGKDMAVSVIQTGAKSPQGGINHGLFNAHVTALHNGRVVDEKTVQMQLK